MLAYERTVDRKTDVKKYLEATAEEARGLEAFRARIEGSSVPDIAARTGDTSRHTRKALARTARQYDAGSLAARVELEHARLDALIERLWPEAEDPHVAAQILRATECRIKLLAQLGQAPDAGVKPSSDAVTAAAREYLATLDTPVQITIPGTRRDP